MKAIKIPEDVDFYYLSPLDFLSEKELSKWVHGFGDRLLDHFTMSFEPFEIMLKTDSGKYYRLDSGDVIIRSKLGEYYSVKRDIFDAEYKVITN